MLYVLGIFFIFVIGILIAESGEPSTSSGRAQQAERDQSSRDCAGIAAAYIGSLRPSEQNDRAIERLNGKAGSSAGRWKMEGGKVVLT